MKAARASLALASFLALLSPACLRVRPAVVPMPTRELSGSAAAPGKCMVLFLPGRRDSFGVYERREFPRMAREAGVDADFVEADAHLGYYKDETISRRLYEDVVRPAQDRGAGRIWVVGISMGGLGGILYAREHPEAARGVVALSPFLGDEEPRLVASAGGLASYSMGAPRKVGDYERELWGWLKRYAAAGADAPPIYLGWGREDDLAPAIKLLADALPPARSFTEKGGHDWPTWTKLWTDFLQTGVLQRDCPKK